MAGAKTWDVDRKKGGTFSFKLDNQGNYTLQKDGFEGIKTLNLPELKKETKTTTTTKDTKTASAQTKEAFGDVQPFYYQGGGADQQYTQKYDMVKDKSLDTSQAMTKGAWDTGKWGPKPDDSTPMTTTGDGPWTMRSGKAPIDDNKSWEKVADSYTLAGQKDNDELNKVYKNMDDAHLLPGVSKQDVESVKQQKDLNRFPGMVGPQKPSPYQDAIMRGEKGVKYEKPGVPQKTTELTKTTLKNVTTGLKPLAKAIGFVMNPIGSAIGMVTGAIKETPVNKHDKGYFNINPAEQGGRISGNPATDLYAGMNRVSSFGNLEKAGAKRISTREKTAAKNVGKWSKEKMDKFNATTNKFKDDQKEYRSSKNKATVKAAVKKGASIHNPNEMRAAGGGGNGGPSGRVICTELHSTGEMSTVDWVRDTRFTFKTLTKSHVKGYLFWAIPTVRHMKKYPLYRKIWKHIAQHRANDIAWRLGESKFDLLGRIYAGIGEPTCWLIGKFVSDKQYNELNLKNWRKA